MIILRSFVARLSSATTRHDTTPHPLSQRDVVSIADTLPQNGELLRRLGLIGKRIHADDGEAERQRHHTNSTEHSILHRNSPSLKPPLDTGDKNCHLASRDRV